MKLNVMHDKVKHRTGERFKNRGTPSGTYVFETDIRNKNFSL